MFSLSLSPHCWDQVSSIGLCLFFCCSEQNNYDGSDVLYAFDCINMASTCLQECALTYRLNLETTIIQTEVNSSTDYSVFVSVQGVLEKRKLGRKGKEDKLDSRLMLNRVTTTHIFNLIELIQFTCEKLRYVIRYVFLGSFCKYW